MGNKAVVALLAGVVLLLAAVLAVGVIFLSRDTRSKATQLREADYDRCVARVETHMEKYADLKNDYLDGAFLRPSAFEKKEAQWRELKLQKREGIVMGPRRQRTIYIAPSDGYFYYSLAINFEDALMEVSADELYRLSKYCRPVLK